MTQAKTAEFEWIALTSLHRTAAGVTGYLAESRVLLGGLRRNLRESNQSMRA